jgi:hypothetical protein
MDRLLAIGGADKFRQRSLPARDADARDFSRRAQPCQALQPPQAIAAVDISSGSL